MKLISGGSWMVDLGNASSFYPYGMEIPGRTWNNGTGYRYGWGGHEKDNEIKGDGNSITTHFRLNDPRTGRWFTMDPVTHFSQSPYVSMDADPINLYDPNGADVISDIGNWVSEAVTDATNWVADAATGAYNGVSDLLTGTDDTPLGPRNSGLIDDIGDAIGSVEIGPISVTEVVPEPEQDNAAISMPSVRPEYEFMANWEYQINSYLYSNDPVFFAVGAVNAMIYTTLDVLMISWSNQAHYWGLNALPARNLKGEFVNNIAVQDAFGGAAGLAIMGLEARLLRMPPTKEVTSGLKNLIPEGKAANHIFSGKTGKLIDNPANRKLITDLTNNPKYLQGVDKYGKSWYAKTLDDGTQLYGYTRNGVVKGAGVNQKPVDFIRKYNLE